MSIAVDTKVVLLTLKQYAVHSPLDSTESLISSRHDSSGLELSKLWENVEQLAGIRLYKRLPRLSSISI